MKNSKQQKTLFITTETNGFDILTRNISRNKFLTDGAKSLYIYLNSHSENFNFSYESIANFLNKSPATIKRQIQELKENGFLTLEKKEEGKAYYYKLRTSPKLEQLKGLTPDDIAKAHKDGLITLNEIISLCKKGTITKKQYDETIESIYKYAKYDIFKEKEED